MKNIFFVVILLTTLNVFCQQTNNDLVKKFLVEGQKELKSGNIETAASNFEKVIELDSSLRQPYLILARLYDNDTLSIESMSNSIKYYKKYLTLNNNFKEIIFIETKIEKLKRYIENQNEIKLQLNNLEGTWVSKSHNKYYIPDWVFYITKIENDNNEIAQYSLDIYNYYWEDSENYVAKRGGNYTVPRGCILSQHKSFLYLKTNNSNTPVIEEYSCKIYNSSILLTTIYSAYQYTDPELYQSFHEGIAQSQNNFTKSLDSYSLTETQRANAELTNSAMSATASLILLAIQESGRPKNRLILSKLVLKSENGNLIGNVTETKLTAKYKKRNEVERDTICHTNTCILKKIPDNQNYFFITGAKPSNFPLISSYEDYSDYFLGIDKIQLQEPGNKYIRKYNKRFYKKTKDFYMNKFNEIRKENDIGKSVIDINKYMHNRLWKDNDE
jgi:hypothetical protein